MALAPVAGAIVLAAWLLLARPARPAPSRDAALVLALVVAVLAVVHGGSWTSVTLIVAAGVAIAATVVRLDACATRSAALAAGVGASVTAIALASLAVVEVASAGVGQVAIATHHANATAALALALAAGSALAWRGQFAPRVLGAFGAVSSLTVLALTGSRGGLVGLAVALGVLAAVWIGYRLVRRQRARAGLVLVGVGALVLLVGLQALLMAPERLAPWLPSVAVEGSDATGPDGGVATLVQRALRDPVGTSGGRIAAWRLARELIATRPLLGFGFDAVDRVYAPAAAAELSEPLRHPHHGGLALLLVGGTLLATALLAVVGGLVWRALGAAVHGDAAATGVAAAFLGLLAMDMLDSMLHLGAVGGVAIVGLLLAISPPPQP